MKGYVTAFSIWFEHSYIGPNWSAVVTESVLTCREYTIEQAL